MGRAPTDAEAEPGAPTPRLPEPLLPAAERMVERIVTAGADDAVVWVRRTHAVDGRLDRQGALTERSGTTQAFLVEVMRNGRLGKVLCNGAGEVTERRAARAALAAVDGGGPPGAEGWVAPFAVRATGGDLGAALADDARRELLRTAATGPAGTVPLGLDYQEERVTTACASTSGCAVEFHAARRRLWQWLDGAGGHFVEGDRTWGDRHPSPALLRQERAELLAVREGGALTAEGSVPVLLAPAVCLHVLSAVAGLLSGSAVSGVLAPLRERVGNRIASPAVTLIDDGRLGTGPDGALLDAEGTPTRRNVLLEQGVLRGFLHMRGTAKACGMTPNGCAVSRSPGSPARPGPRGFRLEPGATDQDGLRGRLGTGFEAVAAVGPGRVRGKRGEFAIDVLGWDVVNGERARPVGPVTLRVGLFAWLRGVRACGSSLRHSAVFQGVAAPAVLMESATLSAR